MKRWVYVGLMILGVLGITCSLAGIVIKGEWVAGLYLFISGIMFYMGYVFWQMDSHF